MSTTGAWWPSAHLPFPGQPAEVGARASGSVADSDRDRLLAAVTRYQPDMAGEITVTLVNAVGSGLARLLESEALLRSKVDEVMRALVGGRAEQVPAAPAPARQTSGARAMCRVCIRNGVQGEAAPGSDLCAAHGSERLTKQT